MRFKLRLTLRAMILWEQMTGRSFSEADFSDGEDVRRVQYCSCVAYADECPSRKMYYHHPGG